ncbi:MAG: homocysteine S-methyltransferase family protein [Coriobacteriales bacterium]|nr:homocysteine S-methyltransferase family protein [Coriobacteriales bacterium]
MADLALRFNKDVLVVEGSIDTLLARDGALDVDSASELLDVLEPGLIIDAHRRYKQAGAQCMISNTVGGSTNMLSRYGLAERADELNRAGVRCALAAQPEHVLACVGSCGVSITDDTATYDAAYAQYITQIKSLAAEGPDAIFIRDAAEMDDAICAVSAAGEACDLPVLVTLTGEAFARGGDAGGDAGVGDAGNSEGNGAGLEASIRALKEAGADAVGFGGNIGATDMVPLIKRAAAICDLPIIAMPAATGPSDLMADFAFHARAAGAQFIGAGLCSDPSYTGAVYAAIGGLDVKTPELA